MIHLRKSDAKKTIIIGKAVQRKQGRGMHPTENTQARKKQAMSEESPRERATESIRHASEMLIQNGIQYAIYWMLIAIYWMLVALYEGVIDE